MKINDDSIPITDSITNINIIITNINESITNIKYCTTNCYVFKFWMLTTTFQKSHALSFICIELCTKLIITKLINKKYRRVQAAPITIGARKKRAAIRR